MYKGGGGGGYKSYFFNSAISYSSTSQTNIGPHHLQQKVPFRLDVPFRHGFFSYVPHQQSVRILSYTVALLRCRPGDLSTTTTTTMAEAFSRWRYRVWLGPSSTRDYIGRSSDCTKNAPHNGRGRWSGQRTTNSVVNQWLAWLNLRCTKLVYYTIDPHVFLDCRYNYRISLLVA